MCWIFRLRRDLEIWFRKFKLGLHEAKTIRTPNFFVLVKSYRKNFPARCVKQNKFRKLDAGFAYE